MAITKGTQIRIIKANPTARTEVGQIATVVAVFEYPGFNLYRIKASRAEVGGNPQWMRGGPSIREEDFEVVA